jgi:membrane-bound ClpP family serine protease
MDIAIVIILCLLGIVLILLEIFLIPGITFAAIAGGLFYAGSIWYAYSHLGPFGGTITLILSILVFGIIFVWLIKSKALETIALKTDIQSTVATEDSLNIKEGDTGNTISRLNPIGKVRVNGITMEAKSLSEFIDEETEIIVTKVSPTQLIVKTKQ